MVSAAVVKQKNVVHSKEIDDRQTPWTSIYIATFMLCFTGIQMSVYYMSTYPYLVKEDPEAGIDVLGYVIAAVSLGCVIANPLFGFWTQKTNSTRHPVMFGFTLAAIGNFLYAILPVFGGNVRYVMLFCRFLTGFGSGTLGVLRGFTAIASVPKDRMTAVAYASAGFTVGLSIGPVIQIIFMPFGADGFLIGPFQINMYTTTAFFMTFCSLLCVTLMYTIFVEDYAGIYSDEEKEADPFLIIPKYDMVPILICFYIWFCLCGVSTTMEGISAPLTMAMYNWNNPQAILYNGIMMTACGLFSAIANFLIGRTRIGEIDGRYQMVLGMVMFCSHNILNYPWPFYDGPLDNVPLINGTENLDLVGGCSLRYLWCEETTRVPVWIYVGSFTFNIGVAFPFVAAPMNAIFSEVLGPRKQGMMQGLLAFTGSTSQFLTPILITQLYEVTGYRYIMVYQFFLLAFGTFLIIFYFRRIVPLKLKPNLGNITKYKRGFFTRF